MVRMLALTHELVHEDAASPHVDLLRMVPLRQLFGCHVEQCAGPLTHQTHAWPVLRNLGRNSEIYYLHWSAHAIARLLLAIILLLLIFWLRITVRQNNVLRLEVPVHNVLRVNQLHSLEQTLHDLCDFLIFKRFLFLKKPFKSTSLYIFHFHH